MNKFRDFDVDFDVKGEINLWRMGLSLNLVAVGWL